MKSNGHKAFWGVLLLLTAVSLVLYGMGLGAEIFGLPLYKLVLAFVLAAWTVSKIVFGNGLRERFRIFTILSFLFMVLETELAGWLGLADANIINNWLLLLAAMLADAAVGLLLPKGKKRRVNVNLKDGDIHIGNDNSAHSFSDTTLYADVSKNRYHYFSNKMGNMHIYYQNADMVEDGAVLELELECKMANTVVHIPSDWQVQNDIYTNMGSTTVRDNVGNRVKLNLRGTNKMGCIVIE